MRAKASRLSVAMQKARAEGLLVSAPTQGGPHDSYLELQRAVDDVKKAYPAIDTVALAKPSFWLRVDSALDAAAFAADRPVCRIPEEEAAHHDAKLAEKLLCARAALNHDLSDFVAAAKLASQVSHNHSWMAARTASEMLRSLSRSAWELAKAQPRDASLIRDTLAHAGTVDLRDALRGQLLIDLVRLKQLEIAPQDSEDAGSLRSFAGAGLSPEARQALETDTVNSYRLAFVVPELGIPKLPSGSGKVLKEIWRLWPTTIQKVESAEHFRSTTLEALDALSQDQPNWQSNGLAAS